jgi:type II secretory pathway pseudopilin PulG
VLAAAAGGAPLIDRGPAQRLARQELARSIYRASWPRRVLNAIGRWLNSLLDGGPGGAHQVQWWAVAALIVVAVLLIAGVLYWLGPTRRSRRRKTASVLGGSQLSAADHRRSSEQLAAGGDFAGAIVERVRAIAVDLEQRGVLLPRPGRTASELATEAAGALPATALPGGAAALHNAARLFDDVRYGGRAGTAAGYEQVRDLDAAVMTARTPSVAMAGGSAPGSGPAPGHAPGTGSP